MQEKVKIKNIKSTYQTKAKKRNGFTLIEVISVIIIIGILAIITVPAVSDYILGARQTTYTSHEKSMEEAANSMLIDCIDKNSNECNIPEKGEKSLIYLRELIDNGYIDRLSSSNGQGYCDDTLSYVEIENTGKSNYEYKACLYCGDYITETEGCTKYENDGDKPVCGTVTGEKMEWTNENVTILVGCSDATSGCLRDTFSKTFTETTKEGTVAGPRVLEHMVDTVLYFEGDSHASYRILRAVKNRFGPANEIGVFEMRSDGLAEVANPSEYMLEGRPVEASGSVVACSMEGSRPVMIEIQALVSKTNFGYPRRTANGTDYNRVNLLMAVLEKRGRMNLSQCDAYINITGGIRMTEPAVDLGILMAIISSFKDIPVDSKTVVFGEVGLSGEVRSVSMAAQRIKEAAKLGFETVVLPASCMRAVKKDVPENIKLMPVRDIRDLMNIL